MGALPEDTVLSENLRAVDRHLGIRTEPRIASTDANIPLSLGVPAISLGASPRAAAGLLIVAKGYAAKEGRDYLIPDDVKEAALPCLRHRLILKPEVELEGFDPDRVIRDVLAATPLPK